MSIQHSLNKMNSNAEEAMNVINYLVNTGLVTPAAIMGVTDLLNPDQLTITLCSEYVHPSIFAGLVTELVSAKGEWDKDAAIQNLYVYSTENIKFKLNDLTGLSSIQAVAYVSKQLRESKDIKYMIEARAKFLDFIFDTILNVEEKREALVAIPTTIVNASKYLQSVNDDVDALLDTNICTPTASRILSNIRAALRSTPKENRDAIVNTTSFKEEIAAMESDYFEEHCILNRNALEEYATAQEMNFDVNGIIVTSTH